MTKYLLILDEEGQERDYLYVSLKEAKTAFASAEDRPNVFSAALFEAKPQGKLLLNFERD